MTILVNLAKSMHGTDAAQMGPALVKKVTMGDWYGITVASAEEFGDVILGIHKDRVVSAYDVVRFELVTDENGRERVRFTGVESEEFAGLIGQPNPGRTWVRGMGRPIQYLDTSFLRNGTVEVTEVDAGIQRAVIAGYTLTVGTDGNARLVAPAGRSITIDTSPTSLPVEGELR